MLASSAPYLYLVCAVAFILGLKLLSAVKTARMGNLISMAGMLLAILLTCAQAGGANILWLLSAMALGGVIGAVWAFKVPMTAMPQMVALFNGFGGGASTLVALTEFFHSPPQTTGGKIAIFACILIGNVTFSGSVTAFGKLQELVQGRPVLFKGQHVLNALILTVSVLLGFALFSNYTPAILLVLMILTLALGVLVVIPIGGADMPVVICLLNSYSGMAVTATGFVLLSDFLIMAGNFVGASGIILSAIMCKAMNRSLTNVLFGGFGATITAGTGAVQGSIREGSVTEASMLMLNARSMIICPGYGMAAAQAQHAVENLAAVLEKNGTAVKYAIHPVAGRMPGHMNVLLAEANVPYDRLYDLDQINDDFKDADVVLVVGANDVVNPAAKNNPGSPIYGMPVLNADLARSVIVLKRSMNPGFAGIDNELFVLPQTMMVFGDAKHTLQQFVSTVKESLN